MKISRSLCSCAGLAALFSGMAASADVLFFSDMVVDRAGSTVVFGESSTTTAMFIDANGDLQGCKRVTSRPTVETRLDAGGFLVRLQQPEDPLSIQIERWDSRGSTEWVHRLPRFSEISIDAIAPTPEGGALLWGYRDPRTGDYDNQLYRLTRDGQLEWRSDLFPGRRPACNVDLRSDELGRILFATGGACFTYSDLDARFGLVNSDGRLAWIRSEQHGIFSSARILYDGNGDFWRYMAPGFGGPRASSSTIQRWTPWGMQLAEFKGPALIPRSEALLPVFDGDDIWFLAKRNQSVELARVGTSGLEARFEVGVTKDFEQMVAAHGAAWVLFDSPNPGLPSGITINRYTRSGLAWQRQFNLPTPRAIAATENGDARVLAGDVSFTLFNLNSRGDVAWSVSLDETYATCEARLQ